MSRDVTAGGDEVLVGRGTAGRKGETGIMFPGSEEAILRAGGRYNAT